MNKSYLLALALSLAIAPAFADDNRDNLVNLQVELSRPLANDVFNASLFIEDSDPNPAKLSQRVNTNLNVAVNVARSYKQVQVSTNALQTYPLYSEKNKLIGWRTRAGLRFESKDFGIAQKLLGELQGMMQVESVGFSVSPEVRTEQENSLIAEAFAAFGQRARLVQKGLGGKGWKVVNISLSTSGNEPPPVVAYRAKTLMADTATAPELAPGESQVRLQVNGTIQVTN